MKDFIITCSSACDLTSKILSNWNIPFVNFSYYFDDKKYDDDFYTTLSIDDFFKYLKTSSAKTSQPDPSSYRNLWENQIKNGFDILHIELTSGISGAYNSALIARDMLLDEYKDSKIIVIDSLCASTGYGLLLKYAYQKKNEIDDIDKLAMEIEKIKYNVNHIFFVSNLDQLIKGGRVSKLSGNIGKMLNVIPVMHLDSTGKLSMIKKVRGTQSAISELINISKANINTMYKTVYICHSNSYNLAIKIKDEFNNNYTDIKINDSDIFNIGSVIACHTGEGCAAIFYIGNGRA